MRAIDRRGRNQRLALLLLGTIAALSLGSVIYINWFHTSGPGTALTKAK